MSRDPIRFRDDPSAPPVLRKALTAAAEVARKEDDAAIGLAQLKAAIAAQGGPSGPSKAVAGNGAAAGKTMSLFGGAFWGIVGVAALVGAWLLLRGSRAPAPPPAPPAVLIVVPPEAPPSASAPASLAPAATEAPAIAPPPDPASSTAPSARAKRPASPARREKVDPDRLAAENDYLERMTAAAAGTPSAALALADEWSARFPDSVFSLERETLVIVALVNAKRMDEARSRAATFITRHGDSPLAARVRRVVGLEVP